MSANGIKASIMFDMRAPAFGAPTTDLYQAALDMAEFADGIGVDRVGLMEHHGSEDGYLPCPFVLGGGVAARTRNCLITLGAVILPLHDPIEVAEQVAILDLMSNGRLEVILGAGYVRSEFDLFGKSLAERGKQMDRGIDMILRALRGERFATHGRDIFIRPLPSRAPEEIILVGGGVEASAKRAARFGLGFSPIRRDLLQVYASECRRLGREPGKQYGPSQNLPMNIHLAEDPESGWREIRAHALHVVSAYARWAEQEPNSNSPFKGLLDEAALRASGLFAVWTPEQLLERAAGVEPDSNLGFQPLLGGLDPAIGWKSLRLLAQVLPQIRAIGQTA